MPEEERYCTRCGRELGASWAFCSGCGAPRTNVSQPIQDREARSAAMPVDVKLLLDAGKADEAASLLRAQFERGRELPVLLMLIDLLTAQHHYSELEPLMAQALAMEPLLPEVRLRRAVYFGRLGLFVQAREELSVGRRYVDRGDLQTQLYCQELERWLREQSKHSFTRQASLPKLPRWLSNLRHKRHALAEDQS